MHKEVKTRHPELSIKGESIERIYSFYQDNSYVVNRRYQRKLVWGIQEKISFIDSIILGYPVPLILLVDTQHNSSSAYEVLDGLQRLNAITSFIEGEYQVNGCYFDLDAMARTKELRDKGQLQQREPKLDRSTCTKIAGYQIPLSIYKFTEAEEIDNVFVRINSHGKHLSRQELRQAGTISNFSELVRDIASSIRGDTSERDVLHLQDMHKISITGKSLAYGITIDDIFWVQESILTRDNIRESKDEELIADLLNYILNQDKPPSSSQILDEIYGRKESGHKRQENLEHSILKHGPEVIVENFHYTHDELKKVLNVCGSKFNQLMFNDAGARMPRYYQSVYLAFYDLLIEQGKVISDAHHLAELLRGIGKKHISIGGGGGRWSATERKNNVNAVVGVISEAFRDRKDNDPTREPYITKLDNLLNQSKLEQNTCEFKAGFYHLSNKPTFNKEMFDQIAKTASAIANIAKDTTGYILIGISDNKEAANRISSLHGVDSIEVNGFYINGIDHEALLAHDNLDRYFQTIINNLKNNDLHDALKQYILKNIRLVSYYDKSLIIIKIKSIDEPVSYKSKFYVRNGPHNDEVEAKDFTVLFKQFHN